MDEPIGRRHELDLAEGLLRATLSGPGSRDAYVGVLLVGGDAGIGKTTFMQVVGSRATTLGMAVAVGHCLDVAVGLPFAPVLEALRSHARHLASREALPRVAAWL